MIMWTEEIMCRNGRCDNLSNQIIDHLYILFSWSVIIIALPWSQMTIRNPEAVCIGIWNWSKCRSACCHALNVTWLYGLEVMWSQWIQRNFSRKHWPLQAHLREAVPNPHSNFSNIMQYALLCNRESLQVDTVLPKLIRLFLRVALLYFKVIFCRYVNVRLDNKKPLNMTAVSMLNTGWIFLKSGACCHTS